MAEKEHCESLIKRWHELQEKLPKAQEVMPGGVIEPALITPEEMGELGDIEKEIKENCLEFLSPEEQWEIKNN